MYDGRENNTNSRTNSSTKHILNTYEGTYLVKTATFVCDFYKSSRQLSGLKFVIFISHKRNRVWTSYFTRLCIIISSTCVLFLVNLDDFFVVVCTCFYEGCGFHQIYSLHMEVHK